MAAAKGRTGVLEMLTGRPQSPMARPSEVSQEAWHCFARNKAETMRNNIGPSESELFGKLFSA